MFFQLFERPATEMYKIVISNARFFIVVCRKHAPIKVTNPVRYVSASPFVIEFQTILLHFE